MFNNFFNIDLKSLLICQQVVYLFKFLVLNEMQP